MRDKNDSSWSLRPWLLRIAAASVLAAAPAPGSAPSRAPVNMVTNAAHAPSVQPTVGPAIVPAGAASARHPEPTQTFGAQDLVRLLRISEVEAEPDGSRVIFTVRSTDMPADRGRTTIWMLDEGKHPALLQHLGGSDGSDRAAAWSKDGRYVYFLSAHGGSVQVWRVEAGGANLMQVSNLPLDVRSFRVSPAADRLIVSLQVYLDCPDLPCTRQRLDAAAKSHATGALHERLFARHWDAWSDGRRSQLFSIPLDERGLAAGSPVNLSAGLDGDVPGWPDGSRDDYAVSPDGAHVVFSIRAAGPAEPWSTNYDLYEVPAEGGPARNLTADNPARDAQPAFSPDGSQLAYLAAERSGYETDRFHLVLLDRESGAKHPLTHTWDRSITNFAWSRDGKTLIATATHLGQRPLWAIDAKSGRAAAITGAGRVEAFSVGAHKMYYTLSNLGSPPDLYTVGFGGGKPDQLTVLNKPLLAQRKLGEYEQFSFAGWHDETVYGYAVRPAGFKPAEVRKGRKYPVALLLHGGPHNSMANEWDWLWNAQTFAGAGYGVVMIDFHGSTGYGQAFTDSINGDWGGKPLEDLKAGVDAALKQYPWMDGARMCALGGSYGGYLVNWILGAWPDRFKCLVSHAGVFDNRSMYYSTEELWFPEWEMGGPEYLNPAAYAKHNPIDLLRNWKTPTLVIHGQQDYRVPYTQGLSTFTALQRRGVPSEFLFFPEENHWILNPADSVQWYDTMIAWLNRWTAP